MICFWLLGTGFFRDVDVITLGIDEVIEMVFLDRYFEGFIYGKIGGLVTGFHFTVVSLLTLGVLLSTGWVQVFGRDTYEMTLGIDKVIELCCSYIYFEVCSDDKHEDLVIGVQDGLNYGVG